MDDKQSVLKELRQIPGVGQSLAEDLWQLGYRQIAELRGQKPEEIYQRLCTLQQSRLDRCVLYVFRCAVYFAETDNPDPEKLKWWNWKD